MHQVSNDLDADDLPNVQWSERRFIPSGSARAGGKLLRPEHTLERRLCNRSVSSGPKALGHWLEPDAPHAAVRQGAAATVNVSTPVSEGG
jgi:hypothetical protein